MNPNASSARTMFSAKDCFEFELASAQVRLRKFEQRIQRMVSMKNEIMEANNPLGSIFVDLTESHNVGAGVNQMN
jgi:hypothetical protein